MLVVSIVTVLIHMVTQRVKDINRLKTLNRSHCFLRKICRKLVLLKTKMFIWTCSSSWILWKDKIAHSSLFIHYSILLKTIPILLINLKTFRFKALSWCGFTSTDNSIMIFFVNLSFNWRLTTRTMQWEIYQNMIVATIEATKS